MPYTPPAQQSPVASRPESPTTGRSHSHVKQFQQGSSSLNTPQRPSLPRSASSTSYLHRHRRSPSVTKPTTFPAAPSTPDTTPLGQDFPSTESSQTQTPTNNGSRTSTPPVGPLSIPTGAVISPPDSAQNSSDDEVNMRKSRVRELENLAELQAAIRIIEQHRESSPNRAREETRKARMALGLVVPSESSAKEQDNSSQPPLSKEARKISHSRSATDVGPFLELAHNPLHDSPSPRTSSSDDDEDDSEGSRDKPPMLRKKSGELVRPALRPSSRRRPSSMPGTPTYSKAVHFDSHLEHVRHFLQVDRPLAVSAGTSPVDNYDNEVEFPFGGGLDDSTSKSPRFQWEIRLSNFPRDSVERHSLPVRVEKVSLSSDNKQLIGTVAVQNLAFHKTVVARFTLDYWKTTSEVVAEYNNDVRRKQANDGCDRFNFTIKLEDLANLENKTLFFCVRYNVNGQEYWDSNGNINFQVDFTKKPLEVKQGTQRNGVLSPGALPRSRPSPPTSAGMPRPKTTCFDEFTGDFGSFPQPATKASFADTPLRFRNTKKDTPTRGREAPAQAFGNRYDFGASLSAAIQAASTTVGDRVIPQPKKEDSTFPAKPAKRPTFQPRPLSGTSTSNSTSTPKKDAPAPAPAAPAVASVNPPKPAALTSEKPSLQSQSYHELLDKYCFFGSAKPASSPQPQPQPKQSQQQQHASSGRPGNNGQTDGAVDDDNASMDEDDICAKKDEPACPTPPVEEVKRSKPTTPTQVSRSQSPATGSGLGSRTASPVSFGYPYRQPLQNGFFGESFAPTAIRG